MIAAPCCLDFCRLPDKGDWPGRIYDGIAPHNKIQKDE
jgi:hypothetical protein